MPRTRIRGDDQVEDISFLSEAELNDFFSTVVITGTPTVTEIVQTFDDYFPGRGLVQALGGLTLTSGSNFVAVSGTDGTTFNPGHVVYVDNNFTPGDGLRDGTFHRPFSNVYDATVATTGSNFDNPYNIIVHPGIYVEPPLTLTSGVIMEALGTSPGATILLPQSNTEDFISLNGTTRVTGFIIGGPSDSGASVAFKSTGDFPVANMDNCILWPSSTAVRVDSGFNLIVNIQGNPGGVYGTIYDIRGGQTILVAAHHAGVFTCATGIHVEGAQTFFANATNFYTSPNMNVGMHAEGGITRTASMAIVATTSGIILDNDVDALFAGCFVDVTGDVALDVLATGVVCNYYGSSIDNSKIRLVDGALGLDGFFSNLDPQSKGLKIRGDISAGSPEKGSEAFFGRGFPTKRSLLILTTDNTASSTVDGGNLTDESDANIDESGNTFTFQGTGVGYSILIGSSLKHEGSDYHKHWGYRIIQDQAALVSARQSFVIEIWNGSAWTSVGYMVYKIEGHNRYSDNIFLRNNSLEGISLGIEDSTTWVSKTINGVTAYWTRIRIAKTINQLPTFEQIRIQGSSLTSDTLGFIRNTGRSRFRQTLLSTGNIFGGGGGVTSNTVTVGSGSSPTGWSHELVNSVFNGTGDSVTAQFGLPLGIDTSVPLNVELKYQLIGGGVVDTTAGEVQVSFLPIEVQGNFIADPNGSPDTIPRSLSATETTAGKAAQTRTLSVPINDGTRIQSVTASGFSIAPYYEGDAVALQVVYTADGTNPNKKDLGLWFLEIEGVKWTLGGRT